jgi:hypothetical protein
MYLFQMALGLAAANALTAYNGTQYQVGSIYDTICKYLANNLLFKVMSLSPMNEFCVALQDALSGFGY